jgi:hypothetical protein
MRGSCDRLAADAKRKAGRAARSVSRRRHAAVRNSRHGDRGLGSATIVNRWFVTNRGLVMGLFAASISTGTLIFFPGLSAIAQVGQC